jgi:hypothetical protein
MIAIWTSGGAPQRIAEASTASRQAGRSSKIAQISFSAFGGPDGVDEHDPTASATIAAPAKGRRLEIHCSIFFIDWKNIRNTGRMGAVFSSEDAPVQTRQAQPGPEQHRCQPICRQARQGGVAEGGRVDLDVHQHQMTRRALRR